MKKTLFHLLFLLICARPAFTQRLDKSKLQSITHDAIKKAYPASVRIWAFDTIKNQQAGPQFSGVVVTPQGHILTAAHVNTPGQSYLVTFPDGKTGIAKGLGRIEYTETPTMPDVAMMKLTSQGPWPFAEMGWSSAIKVNEPVISIAYPESLNQPRPLVRFGSITNIKNEYGFLQSTCMMEPGDSGGPLFDYKGRVIGLHSAINVDVDYEVPVDLYRKYWSALTIPKTYTALPVQEESFGNDPERILTISALSNLDANFAGEAKRFSKHVVLISSKLDEKAEQVSGTLIQTSHGTFIISKSSLVGIEPVVRFANGKSITARIIKRDKDTDLVMLQVASKVNGGIALSAFVKDTISEQQLGTFLISPQPIAIEAQVSVVGSSFFKLNKIAGMGFLGAAVAYKEPVLVTFVQPGSPAASAGIEPGDQILSINNVNMKRPEDYGDQLIKYWAGDTVKFDINRKDILSSKNIVLAARPERPATHAAEMFAGGKSKRRDGFDKVFAHNTKLTPAQCGGPVLDMTGRLYGLNISRFSRTSTIVIPAETILSFINASTALIQRP